MRTKRSFENVSTAPKSIEVVRREEQTFLSDLRSYQVNSGTLKRVMGFNPNHSVKEAIRGICSALREGRLPKSFDDYRYSNARTMKSTGSK